MYICPHCGGWNLNFIGQVTLYAFQNEDGSIDVDPDQEGAEEDVFVQARHIRGLKRRWTLNEDCHPDTPVVCISDKCDGREMQFKDLVKTTPVEQKSW